MNDQMIQFKTAVSQGAVDSLPWEWREHSQRHGLTHADKYSEVLLEDGTTLRVIQCISAIRHYQIVFPTVLVLGEREWTVERWCGGSRWERLHHRGHYVVSYEKQVE